MHTVPRTTHHTLTSATPSISKCKPSSGSALGHSPQMIVPSLERSAGSYTTLKSSTLSVQLDSNTRSSQLASASNPKARAHDMIELEVVFSASWCTDEIAEHLQCTMEVPESQTRSSLQSDLSRPGSLWKHLAFHQDAAFTLPELGFAQVMTQDQATADALGFCDAEVVQLDQGGSSCATRLVLHREYVGGPWELVGNYRGDVSDLQPLTLSDLLPLPGQAAAPATPPPSAADVSSSSDSLPAHHSTPVASTSGAGPRTAYAAAPGRRLLDQSTKSLTAIWRWAWALCKGGERDQQEQTQGPASYSGRLTQLLC